MQATLSEAQGSGQKTLTDSERRYKTLQDQITSKVHEKQSQIEARYEQAIASLKVNEQNLRSRIRADFDLAQQQIKKDYDQAIWLAESVLEAEEGKAVGGAEEGDGTDGGSERIPER